LAKLLRVLADKIADTHGIFAGNVPDLLFEGTGPTGERVPHFVLAPKRHLKCFGGACQQRLRYVD
jgi:hypothetical protein